MRDGSDSQFTSCWYFWIKEHLMHPRLKHVLRRCLSIDHFSKEDVERIQQEKLRNVLRYAASHVHYYQQWFKEHGIATSNVMLSDFPVIDKKTIRGHEKDFVSDEFIIDRLQSTRTSGSTGEPFFFYRERTEWDCAYACLWRGLFRLGIKMGDKRAFVKGVDERPNVSIYTRIRRWVYGVINRCIVIDAHFLAISEENILLAIKRLKRYHPVYIHGYVSSIDLLATTAERHDIRLDDIGVKVIVTESEKLYDFQRERISRIFDCPVAEDYGCVEFGMIAQPDIRGNLCVNDDHVYVETSGDGAAIFTNLDAYAFPFIRFKNGDKVTLRKEKKSGLPYQEFERVDGRMTDRIRLPQGGTLQGFIVMYPIYKHSRFLSAYQVYQPDLYHLIIRVVLVNALPSEIREQMISEMQTLVGDEVQVSLDVAESIPITQRGKRLFICSDVK